MRFDPDTGAARQHIYILDPKSLLSGLIVKTNAAAETWSRWRKKKQLNDAIYFHLSKENSKKKKKNHTSGHTDEMGF